MTYKVNTINRKLKRDGKKERLIKKLGYDRYYWAWEIQTQPFPSWFDAFEYAYKLGYERGLKASQDKTSVE